MKKICLMIVFFAMILIPVFSRADIGAPEVPDYDAIIVEPGGVELLDYNYEGTGVVVPFNTQVIVRYEFFGDNGAYAYILNGNEEGYVKMESIQAMEENVDFSEFRNIEDENLEMYAYKEGAYLYKGPSITYGRVDSNEMVKVGDSVKILYEAGGDAWGYVNYKGTKGWVYYYQLSDYALQEDISSLCKKMPKKQTLITYKDNLKLVSSPANREDYLDVEIPKQTKLEYQYIFELHEDPYVYVTYNGVKGWLEASFDNVVMETKNVYIYINDKSILPVCEEPLNVKKQIDTLENGKVYRINYYSADHMDASIVCVGKIDGKEYWLKENFIENENPGFFFMHEIEDYGYYLVKKECEVYANMNEDSEVIAKIEANKIVHSAYINYGFDLDNERYNQYIYVPNLGFVKEENLEFVAEVEKDDENLLDFSKNDEEEISEEVVNEETEITEIENKQEDLKNNEIKSNEVSAMQIAIICVIIAIIISLTAIVTIKLVNKKKMNN